MFSLPFGKHNLYIFGRDAAHLIRVIDMPMDICMHYVRLIIICFLPIACASHSQVVNYLAAGSGFRLVFGVWKMDGWCWPAKKKTFLIS